MVDPSDLVRVPLYPWLKHWLGCSISPCTCGLDAAITAYAARAATTPDVVKQVATKVVADWRDAAQGLPTLVGIARAAGLSDREIVEKLEEALIALAAEMSTALRSPS